VTFLQHLKTALLPGTHNAYRPYALQKSAVAFYFALILTAESFFVASLYHIEPLRLFWSADTTVLVAWVLGIVALVVGSLLVVTIVVHIQVQPTDVIFPASAVAATALVLLACNVLYGVPSSGALSAAVIQSDIISLTNAERARDHVGVLTENIKLDRAATQKAADMAAKGYFAHVGPDGALPWQWILASGYDYRYAGENLAVRFSESQDVVNAWVASPAHYANIIKSQYTDIGVGTAQGTYQGQPAIYVVQYFAAPSDVSAKQ